MVVFWIISDNSGRAGSRWGFLQLFGRLGKEALGEEDHQPLGLGHFSLCADYKVVEHRRLGGEDKRHDGAVALGAQTERFDAGLGLEGFLVEQLRAQLSECKQFVTIGHLSNGDLLVPHVVYEGGLVGFVAGRLEHFGKFRFVDLLDLHSIIVFLMIMEGEDTPVAPCHIITIE